MKVWTDKWLGQSPLRMIVQGPLTPRDEDQVVADLLDDRGNWCWDKLGYNLPKEVMDRAIGIPRSLLGGIEDRVVWSHEPSGHYSTKSAYNIIRGPKEGDPTDWNWIWEKPISPCIQIFLWQCCHMKVMTRTFLRQRGLDVETTCRVCHRDDETLDHIFRECKVALDLWRSLGIPRSKKATFSLPLNEWIRSNLCSYELLANGLEWTFVFAQALWCLWKQRNRYIFEGRTNDNLSQLCLGGQPHSSHDQMVPTRRRVVQTELRRFSCR